MSQHKRHSYLLCALHYYVASLIGRVWRQLQLSWHCNATAGPSLVHTTICYSPAGVPYSLLRQLDEAVPFPSPVWRSTLMCDHSHSITAGATATTPHGSELKSVRSTRKRRYHSPQARCTPVRRTAGATHFSFPVLTVPDRPLYLGRVLVPRPFSICATSQYRKFLYSGVTSPKCSITSTLVRLSPRLKYAAAALCSFLM